MRKYVRLTAVSGIASALASIAILAGEPKQNQQANDIPVLIADETAGDWLLPSSFRTDSETRP